MDRDTTAPGETLGFALRVYVPKRKTASNKQSSFSGGTDSAVDTQGEPSTSRAGDDRVAVESSSGDSSSPRATPQVPYVGNAVDAYKVKCKLVQKVRYVTDHDLVADTDDQVYMFWTKRVVLKELVASELDLGMAASKSVGIRWELQIPTDIQCSLDTEDVQVRYDVFVDFYPLKIVAAGLGRRLSFRGIARRSPRKSVWCVLPLNVLPVSVSALVANPPEYRPQPA
ncbi:hypothetical protein LPJ56_004378 [Coemansia sp. RSA 2599]|nr:hypothetical protein LPJ75_004195 [Coemansia sp. RSA 2598]KAJ1816102.1 hypothetical protein LPJ56_004378 [Coemansia sp. RSA 2599]